MSFKDIRGQDKPIQILKGYLESSALKGAYLFTGEEGIGKQLAAQNFTKAINCLNKKEDSCDKCSSCVRIDKHQHPDVHFIGLSDSDNIKIESIRDLKKQINLRPYEAKKKVFIINDAHNLTAEGANALLKVLEEPPADSIIILISAKPVLLFKTIISRCKIIKFHPLKRNELMQILKEDYSLRDDPAHFLAYFSEGRIGAALRFKDADILRKKNRVIDDFTLLNKSGFDSLTIDDRNDVRGYLGILTSWFRDLYLIKIGLSHSQLINYDRKPQLLKAMGRYTLLDLDEIIKCISDSLVYLEQNVNIKLLLSNLRAELCRR